MDYQRKIALDEVKQTRKALFRIISREEIERNSVEKEKKRGGGYFLKVGIFLSVGVCKPVEKYWTALGKEIGQREASLY